MPNPCQMQVIWNDKFYEEKIMTVESINAEMQALYTKKEDILQKVSHFLRE